MVCLGNICRSPLAEGILQEKARTAGLDWKVDSAGTTSYHIGEAPHHLSQKVARINGVDISRQRARAFNANDFQRFDKIYAMAGDVLDQIRRIAGKQYDPSKVELLLNELHPGANEDVPDPWYGPEPGYHEVYQLIDAAADRIIERYGSVASAGNAQSVADPTNTLTAASAINTQSAGTSISSNPDTPVPQSVSSGGANSQSLKI